MRSVDLGTLRLADTTVLDPWLETSWTGPRTWLRATRYLHASEERLFDLLVALRLRPDRRVLHVALVEVLSSHFDYLWATRAVGVDISLDPQGVLAVHNALNSFDEILIELTTELPR